jgi:hypothetical protein
MKSLALGYLPEAEMQKRFYSLKAAPFLTAVFSSQMPSHMLQKPADSEPEEQIWS